MGVIGLVYAEVRHWAAEMEIDLSPCMWKKIKALEQWEKREMIRAAGERTEKETSGSDAVSAGRYGDDF